MTTEEMRALGYQVIDYLVDHHRQLEQERVGNVGSYEELDPLVDKDIPKYGQEPSKVFEELNKLVGDNILHLDHPRFFSFIPSPSSYISVLADALATGYNVFAGHWLGGSIAGMIESRTIEWLCQLMKYPNGSGGLFLSGGSMANLTALVAARHHILGEDFRKGRVYYSEQTHSSLSKALRIIGFPKASMRPIPTNDNFQIDLQALRKTIDADREKGFTPCCIAGNAGTTNTGAVDDLDALADIAEGCGAWLHIDAAYGGAAIVAEPYNEPLKALARADSITLDPHKWWFQPYEIGCLLVRDQSKLKEAFSVEAEYLTDTLRGEKEVVYFNHGVQLSRSFRALKLYAFFKCEGLAKVTECVKRGIANAEYLQELFLQKPHWEILTEPSLGIIAFRAKVSVEEPANDKLNAALSRSLFEDGLAMITTTRLKGHTALRMCPIHPETTLKHLEDTVAWMDRFIEQQRATYRRQP